MKLKSLILGILFILCSQAVFAQPPVDSVKPATDPAAWLQDWEGRLAGTTNPSKRAALLYYMAPAAFAAGDMQKAAAFSKDLADMGELLKNRPAFGPSRHSDALFTSNLVLGHIAIKEGQIEKAKEHLLKAADVTGSPVLGSFGPSMTLAKELLERGEKDTVLKYLDLCSKFWLPKSEAGKLGKWKAEIQKGEIPDFRFSGGQMTSWRFAQ